MMITRMYYFITGAVALICMSIFTEAGRRTNRCSVDNDCVAPFICSENLCTHPCNILLDEHASCEIINNTRVFICLPGYQYQRDSNNCQPIQLIDCKGDAECSSSMICYQRECVDPCTKWPAPHTDCIVENHQSIRTCHDGYEHPRGMKRCVLIGSNRY